MGDVSKHFSRHEFACKCGCGFTAVDVELLGILEDVRETFGPVTMLSGCRCHAHNRAVGGAEDSEHMNGTAGDFKVEGRSPTIIANYLRSKYPGRYGIGEYKTWVHVDVRLRMARWKK